jgi:hypothetical protein
MFVASAGGAVPFRVSSSFAVTEYVSRLGRKGAAFSHVKLLTEKFSQDK